MKENKKRFQDCSLLEKIWRCRWFLLLPFFTLLRWSKGLFSFSKNRISLVESYMISIGDIEFKMGWYYTMDEVKKIMEENSIEWRISSNRHFKNEDDDISTNNQ